MDRFFLALFEGTLLLGAGIPAFDMFREIKKSHQDQPDIVSLYDDLIMDWQNPSVHPLKMIGPFIKREPVNSDFVICSGFTELAARTSMVEEYWTLCAQSYLLKKHVLNHSPSQQDCRFAQEILSGFPRTHVVKNYFRDLSGSGAWRKSIDQPAEAQPNFNLWLSQFDLQSKPLPFPSAAHVKVRAEQMGYPELVDMTQQKWDEYSKTIQKA